MKILKYVLILALLGPLPTMAAPASDSSIRQLLEVTQVQNLVNRMRGQFDMIIKRNIQMALHGKHPSASQQQAIEHMKSRMVALMQDELQWSKLEPTYIRMYKETFSGDEINGMLTFYKSPTGQAVIRKMPLLMKNTMAEMQKIMIGTMPKMREIQRDFVDEIKAANSAPALRRNQFN